MIRTLTKFSTIFFTMTTSTTSTSIRIRRSIGFTHDFSYHFLSF
eukprot:06648.XXX_142446_142577_1 [CDS] Oithona nana genome sequencing.